MAAASLQRLWRNEYFKTAVMILLMLAVVFGFWFGTQLTLHTEFPALAVASQSMLPTLNVGDLIIVQGTPPDQIYANYTTGDIIVFKNPSLPDELIVHRAVQVENRSGSYWFTTHGDNNPAFSNEGPFPDTYLVGKVVGKIPNVGNFALFIHSRENTYLFIIILVILIAIVLIYPFEEDEKKKTKEDLKAKRKGRLFGKIDTRIIYILIVNAVIVAFIVFNIWGVLSFWQPGANPQQEVTMRGMYPDVEFYKSFTKPYNNISQVFFSQGFLSYTVGVVVNDDVHSPTLRPGVATFSLAQVALILLIAIDAWEVVRFLKLRKSHGLEPRPNHIGEETTQRDI